ncbi:FKBP-type peptidyl-prolyl cis-trans isomerase [Puia dinghuensis]|uniref:Peptidyl-prolyl cis-trans isomerase n=1 Tax=Puia dinghuensis TaxID=1792502 RepID=A0A8J2U925_9BACT|nr:FKBP-type peptidyl-prolyl cis-trans isomerase [Puia dinghuensis]GGA87558.1 peptidyl-prolyl cis-trans isomerase [Puia dinghuensis]
MVLYRTLLASTLCLSAGLSVFAQTAKTTTPAHKAPTASTTVTSVSTLKTNQDSLSYAIGLSVARFYKQYNITNINTAEVTRAINDVNKKGKLLLTEEQADACIRAFMMKRNAEMQAVNSEKASANKKLGQDFLAANKNKPGVVSLPSGLQYQIIKAGTGPKPAITDQVKVHYHGMLIDGRVFDSSIERGEPIELAVNGVIPGWTEALQLMPVGSKWKLFIPSNLAYGDQQAGQMIAPGSTLIFDVELLDIVKHGGTNAPDSTTNH